MTEANQGSRQVCLCRITDEGSTHRAGCEAGLDGRHPVDVQAEVAELLAELEDLRDGRRLALPADLLRGQGSTLAQLELEGRRA